MQEMGKLDMEFEGILTGKPFWIFSILKRDIFLELCFCTNGCYLVTKQGTVFKIEDLNSITAVQPAVFGPSLFIQQVSCMHPLSSNDIWL